jgi:hypothetical protein
MEACKKEYRGEAVVFDDGAVPPDAVAEGEGCGAEGGEGAGGAEAAVQTVEQRNNDGTVEGRDEVAPSCEAAEREEVADDPAHEIVQGVVAGEGAHDRLLHRLHDDDGIGKADALGEGEGV